MEIGKIVRYSVILLLLGLLSCDTDYYDELSTSSVKYLKIYNSQTDFDLNKDPYALGEPLINEFYLYIGDNKAYHSGIDYPFTRFIDARDENGYSSWSNPAYSFSKIREAINPDVKHRHLYGTEKLVLFSPPAHLHLCLETLDESPVPGKPIGKTWKITSIVDNDGKSLANDPDWTNYTDNYMRFMKATNFIYVPGEKRSDIELDLFGTVKEHPLLFGTYAVIEDESKKVSLKISFPGFEQVFEVVSSSWNKLEIKGTVKSKTGTMVMEPYKDALND